MKLFEYTAHELSRLLRERKVSSEEIVKEYIKRIEEVDNKLHAYISYNFDNALLKAKECDKILSKGADNLPPLFGIPISIKDILCMKNTKVTCGSKILENFIAPYDATVVEKLKNNGLIVIGKCNMDEFAMGSSTENSYFGPSLNPWDFSRVPGGSSGGSAVCVAASESPLSLGTDTGGSIRQPAAFCGVVGLKPTYGRVSRYGLIAFASSLDQIGPFSKDVLDCALIMNVIAGYDEKDSTSVNIETPDYTRYLVSDIKGVRIGIPNEYFIKGIEEDVNSSINNAIRLFEKNGAKVVNVSLPHTEYCLATYYIIATAEASSNLARYDGVHYGYRNKSAKNLWDMYKMSRGDGFGEEVKRRIILGTYVLSAGYYDAYYLKAQKVRTLIKRDFEEAFKECDFILTPTTPTTAFKIGEKISDPVQMYLSDIFTISTNLAGLPAISIPCGFSKENLPIGMQLIGKPFCEGEILKIAYNYEINTDWHLRKPLLK